MKFSKIKNFCKRVARSGKKHQEKRLRTRYKACANSDARRTFGTENIRTENILYSSHHVVLFRQPLRRSVHVKPKNALKELPDLMHEGFTSLYGFTLCNIRTENIHGEHSDVCTFNISLSKIAQAQLPASRFHAQAQLRNKRLRSPPPTTTTTTTQQQASSFPLQCTSTAP